MMYSIQPSITSITGISLRMGAMILAEVGDFSNFDLPDKILAYADLAPSTNKSRKFSLAGRYSSYGETRFPLPSMRFFQCHKVRVQVGTFATCLAKKKAEGKHYNIVISHAAKKLMRVIYALQKSGGCL